MTFHERGYRGNKLRERGSECDKGQSNYRGRNSELFGNYRSVVHKQSGTDRYDRRPEDKKQNIGIEQLVLKVKDILFDGEKTEREQSGLGSARQKKSVQEALERVTHALEISQDSTYGLDAVVQDLEDSLESLGEVAGEVSPDDVLENIFSRFCVGK